MNKNQGFRTLPPHHETCQICAVKHPEDQPHDATSFFYQWNFRLQHNRSVTWADAMAHCSQEVKEEWTNYLSSVGIDINSVDVFGGIETQEELEHRLTSKQENS